jgi:hypothetical protein
MDKNALETKLDIVVIASASRAEDTWFESREGVRILGLNT